MCTICHEQELLSLLAYAHWNDGSQSQASVYENFTEVEFRTYSSFLTCQDDDHCYFQIVKTSEYSALFAHLLPIWILKMLSHLDAVTIPTSCLKKIQPKNPKNKNRITHSPLSLLFSFPIQCVGCINRDNLPVWLGACVRTKILD